ncbi:spermatogenesis-associated protein 21 isoform X3 [Canis lupus familiaris]|uniref:spermatogenesis-associated protein 21 isoform X3 n=1 Tax=Canis lupus familiaris TaxID=9615 RepID=UPI000BAA1A51|nr:spermatogenesis-associated protein 21 isoform X3 [Canis lupus familiaris]XP_038387783.1 spermatogenesis-associated protein 21 isoform X3 [Canis lupus familiaris]|eukprot:XP_022269923.1 spermatogenesis-associated protein 21 isoform X3 [Canis lupus familiaris]
MWPALWSCCIPSGALTLPLSRALPVSQVQRGLRTRDLADNRKAQMYMEGRIKAPGAQPSPGVNTASKRPGAEPTISGVSQVAFADVAGVDSGKQPSSAPGGPEKGPRPRESSEDGPLELRPREQMRPAGPGKKQSAPQEGPGELQAGREQAKPRSELGALPSRVPAAPERKQTATQQGRQQNPGTVKGQVLQSHQGPACQPSPGQQAANGPDIAQPVETSCILDSCGQRPGDKLPKRVDTPHIRPQEALLEPGPGGQKESPQEAMPLKDRAAPEENTADSFSPSTPGPEPLKGRVKTVETEPAPRPVPPPEVRDTVQKRPPEPRVAAGAQTLGNLRQGFMKCLLQVEEEEATRRRAAKARRSPRTLTPAPASAPQSLPPALPQSPASAPAMAPSWARAPAPRGSPGPASGPFAGLDTGWRRAEPWSGDRSLTGTKARSQELEERGLFTLYQTWDERLERLEEQLTVRQEEAFRSYFEIFNGHGEVDAQSLGNILLLVGISLTPAQVEDALMSADVDGDGRVGFKDFLAVLTDTRRFFCSVEQNALADMAPPNPHTLFFEILSLLVEMLALPETALEEITNYYQKKLKEGTCKAREMELAIGRLRSRKKLPYNLQEADLEVPERRVLRILSRLKQQNYAANLQSPYAQVPCIPLCPRLDKKMVRRKQGSQYVLDPCTPASLGPDIHSLLFQSGSQGSREHGSECRKWLSSVPARTH